MKNIHFYIGCMLAISTTLLFSCQKDTSQDELELTNGIKAEEAFPGQSGVWKTATIAGNQISYEEINGQKVFEGDILLSSSQVQEDNIATEGTYRTATTSRWPQKTIYYTIDPTLPDQFRITSAISRWEKTTSIRFAPRTTQTNYVTFRPVGDKEGCSSAVGQVGGQQFVNVSRLCSAGNITHEIGHTVGLWHEISRSDRDQYVTIRWGNIQSGKENNFKTYKDLNFDGAETLGGLDFGSIMMYSSGAFSSNGKGTFVRKDGTLVGESEVQRSKLSAKDIEAVAIMYK